MKIDKVNRKAYLKSGMWLAMALGFWTFLYPEYCLKEGIYKVVDNNGKGETRYMCDEEYEQFLKADSNHIIIKSELWNWVCKTLKESKDR